jgi:predicted metal-dependent peptidase
MTEIKDKEERKLQKCKIALMRNSKFALWSGVMMVGTTSISDGVPTAYTNGRDEVYGRDFVKRLPERQLSFVILHEALHKAFRHLTTWQKLYKEDPRLANYACDYVINNMLVKMDPNETVIAFPMKDGKRFGLYDEKYDGLHAKQVFDLLKQEQKQGGGGGGKGEGDGKGDGEGFDEHGWDEAKEMTEKEKDELVQEIDQALRQGQIAHAKANGEGAGNMSRELAELLEPKIDWREVLREFVTTVCSAKDASSWRRVNRRFLAEDVYMPTLIGERVGRVAIGVDTSGSIGGKQIAAFLSEVKAIADNVKPEFVDLIYWDSAVASHEEYHADNLDTLISSTKPKGGGGTDPTCMMKYLDDKSIIPECIVMLTDGEIGDWGSKWNAPILWVIVNNRSITAPVGKSVFLKED